MQGHAQVLQPLPRPGRILLVDDEPDILAVVKNILELSIPGWTVDVAESGQAALKSLAENLPTILVSDYRMPGMTGLELASNIRAAGHEFPIVIVTAFVDSKLDDDVAKAQTVQSLLRKPLDVDKLVATILALSGKGAFKGPPLDT